MALDTLIDGSNETIISHVSVRQMSSKQYLDALKQYITETYIKDDSETYDSVYTESSYIFIDDLKIRISDHISTSCSYLNIIKTKDNSDNFIIIMNKNKQPYLMKFEEVKLFIKHYLMIHDSKIAAEKAKDASALIKSANSQNTEKQKEQSKLSTYIKVPLESKKTNKNTLREELSSKNFEEIDINEFNTSNYINKNWKAFEAQYLINDLNWYGDLPIADVRRNYICMIICKCAYGGLSYKETIDFIGDKNSIDDLAKLLAKAKDLYDNDMQRAHRILCPYNNIDKRLKQWDNFINDFYSVFPWTKDLAQTNKDLIFAIYKKDLPIKFLTVNMYKIYKNYGNMKYNACLAYRDLIKEKVDTYNKMHN